MNFVGFTLYFIGLFLLILFKKLIKTRFYKIVGNNAYAKLLIITGGLEWHDLPHLHHPLIHLRIDLEERILNRI